MPELSAEDIAIMRQAISDYDAKNGSGFVAPHADAAEDASADAIQDRKMLQAIVQALEAIIEEVETLKECHLKLESKVNDEIIGGISKLYHENERLEGISDVRKKYGEMFSPFEETFRALQDDPNADLYSKLYDMIQDMKSGEGYSEELEGNKMHELLEKFKSSVPGAVAVEVTKTPEGPQAPELDGLTAKLMEMKRKAGNAGTF